MFGRIALNIKAILVVFRLARYSTGSITYRLSVMNKYYPVYIYHTKLQK